MCLLRCFAGHHLAFWRSTPLCMLLGYAGTLHAALAGGSGILALTELCVARAFGAGRHGAAGKVMSLAVFAWSLLAGCGAVAGALPAVLRALGVPRAYRLSAEEVDAAGAICGALFLPAAFLGASIGAGPGDYAASMAATLLLAATHGTVAALRLALATRFRVPALRGGDLVLLRGRRWLVAAGAGGGGSGARDGGGGGGGGRMLLLDVRSGGLLEEGRDADAWWGDGLLAAWSIRPLVERVGFEPVSGAALVAEMLAERPGPPARAALAAFGVRVSHAARTIQRAWRRAVSDPRRALCAARLRREFGELRSDMGCRAAGTAARKSKQK